MTRSACLARVAWAVVSPRGMYPMRCLTVFLLVLAVVLINGCGGWYLRGQGPKPAGIASVFIDASNAPEIATAVRQEFANRGLAVTGLRSAADVVVTIEGERYSRRVLSVDPDTGKVREIELGLEAYFSVRAGDGRLLITREPLDWQLDYVFDEGSLLGTVEQDIVIKRDLATTAATTLVLRLQTVELPPPRKSASTAAP